MKDELTDQENITTSPDVAIYTSTCNEGIMLSNRMAKRILASTGTTFCIFLYDQHLAKHAHQYK